MIQKIIALTLERSVARQWIYFARQTAMGIDPEIIYFFRGVDDKRYENVHEIGAAATADGYPVVAQFQGYRDNTVINQSPAQMAQIWNWLKILKHIAEQDKLTLVSWDDRYISVPFPFLQLIVDSLVEDPDFYAFQLRLRGIETCIRLPPPADDSEAYPNVVKRNRDLFKAFTNQHHQPDFLDLFVRRGFYGYDETIVFSPRGAKWMYDIMMDLEDIDPDIKKMDHVDMQAPQFETYLSRLNIDSYLCWDFRKHAVTALEDGIGLYCPRYPGYDFIEDSIPLGSLTEWAAEERPDYAIHNKTTELQYIE